MIVPPGDDGGVFALNKETTLVETVDIITPLVDDPTLFGKIATTNSLSDIYAMGGTPLTALAILGYPACDVDKNTVRMILTGALEVLKNEGVHLLGGHTFDDQELKFGLSVTGTVNADNIIRKEGAVPGDNIVITKPIGTGIITTAYKGGKIKDKEMEEAVSWMLRSNKEAAMLAINSGVHSGTDITGFGLLGHAFNMVRNQEVDFVIDHRAVPFMEGAADLADLGIIPEGAYENLKHLKTSHAVETNIDDDTLLLLTDPQTSGGLLLSLDDRGLETFLRDAEFSAVIGKVQRGSGKLRVV